MYESHFRLRELPFNITPDPRFFYASPSCKEAFVTICYGIEQRKGVILVSGEAGTGKTTLLKLFIQTAPPQVRASCILDPHLTFVELLRCALDGFGLSQSSENRFELIQMLEQYLIQQRTYHHQVALLLDEGQQLNDDVLEELRLLSDLEYSGERLLQLVLVGQPELESKMDLEKFHQLRQRITLRTRVTPLKTDEIGPYIDFRLRIAGYAGKSIFRATALQRIGYFSQGIPRLINVICDNALLNAYVGAQDSIGAETIDEIAEDLQLGGHGSGLLEVPTTSAVAMACENSLVDRSEKADKIRDQRFARSLRLLPNISHVLAKGAIVLERLAGRRTKRFFQQWWLEMSAAMATMIVLLLGGIYLSQPDASVSMSPVTEKLEQIREVFAPLPGTLRESSFKEPVLPTAIHQQPERSGAAIALHQKKTPGDRSESAKPTRKDLISDRQKKVASIETKRPSSTEQPKTEPRQPHVPGSTFAVVENSYVRDKPTSKAEVIATLRPGTHIQVVGRIGSYFRVRSLDNEAVRGYVHKEDAFFEPYH